MSVISGSAVAPGSTYWVRVQAIGTGAYSDGPYSAASSVRTAPASTIIKLGNVSYSVAGFYRVVTLGTGITRGVDVSSIVLPTGATGYEYRWNLGSNSFSGTPLSGTASSFSIGTTTFGTLYMQMRAVSSDTSYSTGDWVPGQATFSRPPKLAEPTFTLTADTNGVTVNPSLPPDAEGYIIRWGRTSAADGPTIVVSGSGSYKISVAGRTTIWVRIRSLTTSSAKSASDFAPTLSATTTSATLPAPTNASFAVNLSRRGNAVFLNVPLSSFPLTVTGVEYRTALTLNGVRSATEVLLSGRSAKNVTIPSASGSTTYAQIRWARGNARSVWSPIENATRTS